jgi:glutaredoxin 3
MLCLFPVKIGRWKNGRKESDMVYCPATAVASMQFTCLIPLSSFHKVYFMSQPELLLYHNVICPYCVRVRRFLSANNISIPEKDTLLNPSARRELIEAGGKGQVPALMIDGQILYESNDIIQWVKQNVMQTSEAA